MKRKEAPTKLVSPSGFDLEVGGENSADKCRRMGWVIGDILEGTDSGGTDRIVLTAIGETCVLARAISQNNNYESGWSLQWRNWKKVGP